MTAWYFGSQVCMHRRLISELNRDARIENFDSPAAE
jgi:hypothetical protein